MNFDPDLDVGLILNKLPDSNTVLYIRAGEDEEDACYYFSGESNHLIDIIVSLMKADENFNNIIKEATVNFYLT